MGQTDAKDNGNEESASDIVLDIIKKLIAKPWLKISALVDTKDGRHLLGEILECRHFTSAVFFSGMLIAEKNDKGNKVMSEPDGKLLAEETARLATNILQAMAYAGAEWAIKTGITLEQLDAMQVPMGDDDQDDELLARFLNH